MKSGRWNEEMKVTDLSPKSRLQSPGLILLKPASIYVYIRDARMRNYKHLNASLHALYWPL